MSTILFGHFILARRFDSDEILSLTFVIGGVESQEYQDEHMRIITGLGLRPTVTRARFDMLKLGEYGLDDFRAMKQLMGLDLTLALQLLRQLGLEI